MRDPNIARKIVRCLEIQNGDDVLEIGPGPGALTGHAEAYGPGRLVLVEKDRFWAEERKRLAGTGTHVILADALMLNWSLFATPWRFMGNLPYNVASPLIWDICSQSNGFVRAVFMVQKEVGLRLTAAPSTSAYGALSVWVQSHVRTTLEFIVPPQVFYPKPKVDSAVVSFIPLDKTASGEPCFSPDRLAQVLRACFQKRRKQLGSIGKTYGIQPERFAECGLDPRKRPEELYPEEFQRLAEAGFFQR